MHLCYRQEEMKEVGDSRLATVLTVASMQDVPSVRFSSLYVKSSSFLGA